MSVLFDSAGEYIARNATVPAEDPLTVFMRFYLVSATNVAFIQYSNGGGNYINVRMASGLIQLTTSAVSTTNGSSVSTGVWHDLCYVRNGSSHIIYIDGVIALTATQAITVGLVLFIFSSTSTNANMRMADIRMWTRELTQNDYLVERSRYDTPSSTVLLWANWPLKVHTDLTDGSGNGRTLIVGGTLSTAADPVRIQSDGAILTETSSLTAGGTSLVSSDDATLTETSSLSSGGTSIAVSDSGTFSDSCSLVVSVSRVDSGSFVDTSSISTGSNPSSTDSGNLTESSIISGSLGMDEGFFTEASSLSLAVQKIATDSGSVSEIVGSTATRSSVESGTVSELVSLTSTRSSIENGTLSEISSLTCFKSSADIGIFSETVNSTTGRFAIDSSTLVDIGSISSLLNSVDVGSLTDNKNLVVAMLASDSGNLTDNNTLSSFVSSSENGVLLDSVFGLSNIWSRNDSANLIETNSINTGSMLSSSDNGSFLESCSLSKILNVSDSATLIDSRSLEANFSKTDIATLEEELDLATKLFGLDSIVLTDISNLSMSGNQYGNDFGNLNEMVILEIDLNSNDRFAFSERTFLEKPKDKTPDMLILTETQEWNLNLIKTQEWQLSLSENEGNDE